ncbi:MAG: hypothetical protein HY985_16665 [Magnetospirillum sp.]|nr:hypothetical protein [Magnetospirillum sp.]
MSRSTVAATLLLAALALPAATPAQAKACNSPTEVSAMQLRQLQAELMVATLKCGETHPEFRGKYGAFVGKAPMKENANALRAMFSRQGKGANYMDRYSTQLANDAQLKSSQTYDYCGVHAARFDELSDLRPHEIQGFAARSVGVPDDAEPCPAPKPAAKEKVAAKDKTPAKVKKGS